MRDAGHLTDAWEREAQVRGPPVPPPPPWAARAPLAVAEVNRGLGGCMSPKQSGTGRFPGSGRGPWEAAGGTVVSHPCCDPPSLTSLNCRVSFLSQCPPGSFLASAAAGRGEPAAATLGPVSASLVFFCPVTLQSCCRPGCLFLLPVCPCPGFSLGSLTLAKGLSRYSFFISGCCSCLHTMGGVRGGSSLLLHTT